MNKRSIIRYLLVGVLGMCLAYSSYLLLTPLDGNGELDRRSRTVSVLSVCGKTIEQWQRENGRVPTVAEGLAVLKMKSDLPLDGWGKPLVYRPGTSSQGPAFELYSLGPRGIDEGGNGDNVNYWRIPSAR